MMTFRRAPSSAEAHIFTSQIFPTRKCAYSFEHSIKFIKSLRKKMNFKFDNARPKTVPPPQKSLLMAVFNGNTGMETQAV
jgi:hypothetical protein